MVEGTESSSDLALRVQEKKGCPSVRGSLNWRSPGEILQWPKGDSQGTLSGSRAQGQALASTWSMSGQTWGPDQGKIVSLGLKEVGAGGRRGDRVRRKGKLQELMMSMPLGPDRIDLTLC